MSWTYININLSDSIDLSVAMIVVHGVHTRAIDTGIQSVRKRKTWGSKVKVSSGGGGVCV